MSYSGRVLEKTKKNIFFKRKTYLLNPNDASNASFGLFRCWGIVWGADDVAIAVGDGRSAWRAWLKKKNQKPLEKHEIQKKHTFCTQTMHRLGPGCGLEVGMRARNILWGPGFRKNEQK